MSALSGRTWRGSTWRGSRRCWGWRPGWRAAAGAASPWRGCATTRRSSPGHPPAARLHQIRFNIYKDKAKVKISTTSWIFKIVRCVVTQNIQHHENSLIFGGWLEDPYDNDSNAEYINFFIVCVGINFGNLTKKSSTINDWEEYCQCLRT